MKNMVVDQYAVTYVDGTAVKGDQRRKVANIYLILVIYFRKLKHRFFALGLLT